MCLDCGETNITKIAEYGLIKKHLWSEFELTKFKADILRISKDRMRNVLETNFNCFCSKKKIQCNKCQGEGDLPRWFSSKRKKCIVCNGIGYSTEVDECSYCLILNNYHQGLPYLKQHYRTKHGIRYPAYTTTKYKTITKTNIAEAIFLSLNSLKLSLSYSYCQFCGSDSNWKSKDKSSIEEHEKTCNKRRKKTSN